MTEETVSVTVRMPDQLLEGLEDLYGEDGPYEDRTEAVVESIEMFIGDETTRSVNRDYDSLVTEYVDAIREDDYARVEELDKEILELFPDTELAEELESEKF